MRHPLLLIVIPLPQLPSPPAPQPGQRRKCSNRSRDVYYEARSPLSLSAPVFKTFRPGTFETRPGVSCPNGFPPTPPFCTPGTVPSLELPGLTAHGSRPTLPGNSLALLTELKANMPLFSSSFQLNPTSTTGSIASSTASDLDETGRNSRSGSGSGVGIAVNEIDPLTPEDGSLPSLSRRVSDTAAEAGSDKDIDSEGEGGSEDASAGGTGGRSSLSSQGEAGQGTQEPGKEVSRLVHSSLNRNIKQARGGAEHGPHSAVEQEGNVRLRGKGTSFGLDGPC